ncbi:MAG: hypothetical protein R3B13_40405 [Polyangiaceae bacterium]
MLKPEVLDLVYERTAQKVKEQFKHVPEELRLKKIELNRAETRVHNFVEFVASGRATPALADRWLSRRAGENSRADIDSMEAAKDDFFRVRPVPGSPTASRSSTSSWASARRPRPWLSRRDPNNRR